MPRPRTTDAIVITPRATNNDAATWKLDGTIEDLQVVYGVGKEVAAGERWPNWYPGNPFKAARDRMMAGKPGASAASAQPADADSAATQTHKAQSPR